VPRNGKPRRQIDIHRSGTNEVVMAGKTLNVLTKKQLDAFAKFIELLAPKA
jgi:hypothetical protein